MALRALRKDQEPDTYHGIDILDLHVGDPIPTPRAPMRRAVKITPDLARYLLTFNVENNRRQRGYRIALYASVMRDELWAFTPQGLVFNRVGRLEDGQNRLVAITEYGKPVWMIVDFGWPEGIIQSMDRGMAKVSADALRVEGVGSTTIIAGGIQYAHLYGRTVGTDLRWGAKSRLSDQHVVLRYKADPDLWERAARAGTSIYSAYHALSASVWTAAYAVISEHAAPDLADEFYAELRGGTGAPASATRTLERYYTRRKLTDTVTGDTREPMENIIRAFNAWGQGRTYSRVTRAGFTLSRVKA